MSVEACLPFDKSTLQYEEFEDLVRRVSLQADCLEHGEDARDRTVSSEAGRASALKLRARLKGLGPKYDIEEGLPETDIVVSMKDNERRQRIRILRDGRQYIFVTLVHEAIGRQWSPQEQQRMAVRAWERNALTELVNFTLDERGRLVGEIRHLADHLDAEELELYLRVLATEGDRFEYVLTGRDRF